jgi:hypothetical protein
LTSFFFQGVILTLVSLNTDSAPSKSGLFFAASFKILSASAFVLALLNFSAVLSSTTFLPLDVFTVVPSIFLALFNTPYVTFLVAYALASPPPTENMVLSFFRSSLLSVSPLTALS